MGRLPILSETIERFVAVLVLLCRNTGEIVEARLLAQCREDRLHVVGPDYEPFGIALLFVIEKRGERIVVGVPSSVSPTSRVSSTQPNWLSRAGTNHNTY